MTATIPNFTMQDLFEAGVHFGHRASLWNPVMESFIYGKQNNIHIIDLQKTTPLLHNALSVIFKVAKQRGRILFIGTKMQVGPIIAEAAERCGQHYINHRWLGGTFTNWPTISGSIKQLVKIEESLAKDNLDLTKKEKLTLQRKKDKMDRLFCGIKEMGGLPDLVFIIDANKENTAVKEAKKAGIPIVAVVDTNCDPRGIDYPIPGNDDSTRAIKFYCELVAESTLAGIEVDLSQSGAKIKSTEDVKQYIKQNNDDQKQANKKTNDSSKNEDMQNAASTSNQASDDTTQQ